MIRAVSKILKWVSYLVHQWQKPISEYILKRKNCTHNLISPFSSSLGAPLCPCPDAQIIFTVLLMAKMRFHIFL